MRVPAGGGSTEVLAPLAEGEITQRWPQFIDGGGAVLFTSHSRIGDYNDAQLIVLRLPRGPRKVVQTRAYYGRLLPSGHLMFLRDGALFAQPFNSSRSETVGQAVPIAEGVVNRSGTGGAQFDVSPTGTLVYLTRPSVPMPLQFVDRTGRSTALTQPPTNWNNPRFSPDGRRIALEIGGADSDVWIYDWTTGAKTRLTVDRSSSHPVWTPDGRRIVFASRRDGRSRNLYWQRADGSGDVQRLTESPNDQLPESWHPDGRALVFAENKQSTDVMILPVEGDEASGWKPGTPVAFAATSAHELNPSVSPDGRWIAYAFNEAARFVVYVRPFKGSGGPWVVSEGAGNNPVWSRSRPELFYSAADQRLMVAPYTVSGDSFRVEAPRPWSNARLLTARLTTRDYEREFDIHPDGDRFAVAGIATGETRPDMPTFVFNIFDELRRIAPTAR
jgi:dipeptidyl aminopeptidase/acylaminoacyl peptidase